MDKSPQLDLPFPALQDKEDDTVPSNLTNIIDSHVHVFPEPVFKALWEWFEKYAWPIRYKGTSSKLLDYLLKRGVRHIVALQYAHKPGHSKGPKSVYAQPVPKIFRAHQRPGHGVSWGNGCRAYSGRCI